MRQAWQAMRAALLLGLAALGAAADTEPYTRAWVARLNGPVNGYDQVRSLAVAPNGDIVATGQVRGQNDVFELAVWRLTPNGMPSPVWADTGYGVGVRRYRALVDSAVGESVAVHADGTVYVGGYAGSLDKFDNYLLLKFDATGNLSSTWADAGGGVGVRVADRLGGPDQGKIVVVRPDHQVYLSGRSAGVTTPAGIMTMRYAANGASSVQAYVPGSGLSEPLALFPWEDGGAVIVAKTTRPTQRFAYLLLRYTSTWTLSPAWSGGTAGVRLYEGISGSGAEPAAAARRADGGVVVTGKSANTDTLYDTTTVSYSESGTQLWVARRRNLAGASDEGVGVAVAGDGSIYVLAQSVGAGSGLDFEILRYTPEGTLSAEWPDVGWGQGIRRWNGPSNDSDRPRAIKVDRLGNVYVTGRSSKGEGVFSWVVLKYLPDGRLAWADEYQGPEAGTDQPETIAIGDDDTVYVGGMSTGTGTGQDGLVIAYTQQLPSWVAAPESQLGQAGAVMRLTAEAEGRPGLVYTWKKDAETVGVGPSLIAGPVSAETAGRYVLEVSDGFNLLRKEFIVAGIGLRRGPETLYIDAYGPAGQSFVIDQSLNLTDWTPWQSIVHPGGTASYAAPLLPESRIFYRLRLPQP